MCFGTSPVKTSAEMVFPVFGITVQVNKNGGENKSQKKKKFKYNYLH